MEEKNKHTYTTSHYIQLRCYYCKSEWEEYGVQTKYKCRVCEKEAEAIPKL